MKLHLVNYCAPGATAAAVRLLARMLLRDGTVDWRVLDLLERMDAFRMLGIERGAFLQVVESLAAEHGEVGKQRSSVFEPELQLIDSRPLQILVCSFLVRMAEADGEVSAGKSALVRKAFLCWNVSPETLRRETGIPVHRSLASLGMLPEAA